MFLPFTSAIALPQILAFAPTTSWTILWNARTSRCKEAYHLDPEILSYCLIFGKTWFDSSISLNSARKRSLR